MMTYPDTAKDPNAVGGVFRDKSRGAEKSRERLTSVGKEWFNRCQQQRSKQEQQWYLNLAFYYGNQYVQPRVLNSTGSFDLYTPKAPPYRVRLIVNQTRKIIRKEISRLTAQKPNAFVVPASTEDQDVFAAQAGEEIWDSLWRRLKLPRVLRDAVFWQSVCGNGFLKSYWDPNKRDMDQNYSNPATGESTPVYGDISIIAISPFHIFVPDLMPTDIEEEPYVIHAQTRNVSWVRERFGIDATSNTIESVDNSMRTAMGVTGVDSRKDQVTVLEVWVKPGYLPELPEGGMFTIAANQLVDGVDYWPYEHGQYPFEKLDGTATGKFYNASIVEDLIPLQRELNRTRSQLVEAKNKMSKPQLTAEEGAVDAKRITTEPGLLIEYKIGMNPPQPLPLQGIPSYVTEELNRLYDDMADISGQHEVSNGSTPPGVTAATAISFLQEQDESIIAANYASIEEAIEKMAYQSLVYVKTYWDESRLVKTIGTEGTFDIKAFKGSDLRGNTDVRIESGSSLPTSRAAKQAFIMDLMKMGFVDPSEGLEILEIGGLNRIYERIQIDKRQAQRENLKMRVITDDDMALHRQAYFESQGARPDGVDPDSGMPLDPPLVVPVHTYDNHEVHIQMHNNYRKSQNFETASDATKALFEEHVKQHQEALAGVMTHPLTGMDPSDPNAPPPEEEEEMEQSTGPMPMPDLQSEAPPREEGGA